MKVTARRLYPMLPGIFLAVLPFFVDAQCGTCTYTETALEGTSPVTTTCVGSASVVSPVTCANNSTGSLVIDGTLRICDGVSFNYYGTITGSGAIEIMSGAHFLLYGTYDCQVQMTAVDPSLLSGTSTSSIVGSCNAPNSSTSSCEPVFPGSSYTPFEVVGTGQGYTVYGATACTITGGTENYVLPLQLTSWTAVWQGSAALLSWSASNDDQHYQYGIDYSMDGQTWTTLPATIAGSDAAGPHEYSYLAPGPFAVHNFFRLHWQDPTGRVTYSSVKTLDTGEPGADALFIGPNPIQSALLIRTNVSMPYTLELLDVTGTPRLQLSATADGSYDVGSLSPGTYFLVLLWGNGTRTVKKLTKL
jgi:hypothetical protein